MIFRNQGQFVVDISQISKVFAFQSWTDLGVDGIHGFGHVKSDGAFLIDLIPRVTDAYAKDVLLESRSSHGE